MAEKIRYTRKDLKEPDEFVSWFGRIVLWSRENKPKVIAIILVAAGVFGLVFGGRTYFQWRDRQAAVELWPYLNQAHEILIAPIGAETGDMAAIEKEISSLAAKHKGAKTAFFAQYYLGGIAFKRGDYEAGAERYREAIKTMGKDDRLMAFLLYTGLGSSLEAKGDYEGASEAYGKAAEAAELSMRMIARFDTARALELAGKKNEAIALYRQIEEEYPIQKDLIEVKIARME